MHPRLLKRGQLLHHMGVFLTHLYASFIRAIFTWLLNPHYLLLQTSIKWVMRLKDKNVELSPMGNPTERFRPVMVLAYNLYFYVLLISAHLGFWVSLCFTWDLRHYMYHYLHHAGLSSCPSFLVPLFLFYVTSFQPHLRKWFTWSLVKFIVVIAFSTSTLSHRQQWCTFFCMGHPIFQPLQSPKFCYYRNWMYIPRIDEYSLSGQDLSWKVHRSLL